MTRPFHPISPVSLGSQLLDRSRTDLDSAIAALNRLQPQARASACLDVHPEQRHQLLELLDCPAEIVPLLPEVELVRTLLGGGLADTHWLLQHATPDQRIACLDLHCWRDSSFDTKRFREWLDAMIEAGTETLRAALAQLDLETWVLALRDMAQVSLGPSEDAETEDGFFYFTSDDAADAERLHQILRTTLSEEPHLYLRLVTALFNENVFEAEEHARVWHRDRMADLGFPEREEAMGAYRPLRPEEAPKIGSEKSDSIPPASAHVDDSQTDSSLAIPSNPLADALRELPAASAEPIQAAILALANTLAIADQLDLSAPDTGTTCLERALRGVEQGLLALTTRRGRAAHEILAETRPIDLFRIGFTLDATLGPAQRTPDDAHVLDDREEEEDPVFQELLAILSSD